MDGFAGACTSAISQDRSAVQRPDNSATTYSMRAVVECWNEASIDEAADADCASGSRGRCGTFTDCDDANGRLCFACSVIVAETTDPGTKDGACISAVTDTSIGGAGASCDIVDASENRNDKKKSYDPARDGSTMSTNAIRS